MNSIEQSNAPLVYKLADDCAPVASQEGRRLQFRTAARALAGMQKEALVSDGANNVCWRIVCDEGPWLNGTDLAPFPLGFFTAGLVASYLSEFLTHARAAEIHVRDLEIMVDNHYTMAGSLTKGTMIGSALPVEATFSIGGDIDATTKQHLAHAAVASSPADAYLRNAVDSVFSLNHNGTQIPVTNVAASRSPQPPAPGPAFRQATPLPGTAAEPLIVRLDEVDMLGGEKLGSERSVAVGLTDQQKRSVHVRGVGKLREDGMKTLNVACFKPIGSVFEILSDDSVSVGGKQRAPSGLVYLSAGIAFCFMTQLGRYAQVAKHDLEAYEIVQDTSFSVPAVRNDNAMPPTSAAVDTAVFVATRESAEDTQTLLSMGEQTCYLHAACHSALKTRLKARL